MLFGNNSFASLNEYECFGNLSNDISSRFVKLTYDLDSKSLVGYKAAYEVGGFYYRAKLEKNNLELSISKPQSEDESIVKKIIVKKFSKKLDYVEVKVDLGENYTAELNCSK